MTTYGTTESAHFPIKNSDYPVFSRMKDEIVQFVIPMNNPKTNLVFIGEISSVPCNQFVKVRNIPDFFPCLNIRYLRLCRGYPWEGFNLPREIRCGRSKGGQTDGSWRDRAKGCKGTNGRQPARATESGNVKKKELFTSTIHADQLEEPRASLHQWRYVRLETPWCKKMFRQRSCLHKEL